MDYRRVLDQIRSTVRQGSYLVPPSAASGPQKEALAGIASAIADPNSDPEVLRRKIHQLHAAGRIDRVMMLSSLGVLAASPGVRDYAEAARLAGQQELAALEQGGPRRDTYLASADRHRGVLAYLLGQYEVALDWFGRALGRERSSENLGNVLAALVRLGDIEAAAELRDGVSNHFPREVAEQLVHRIANDEDLIRLRPTQR